MSQESIFSQVVNWWVGKIIMEKKFKPEDKEKLIKYCFNRKSNGWLPVIAMIGMKFIGQIKGKINKCEIIGYSYTSYDMQISETKEIFYVRIRRDGVIFATWGHIGHITEII